MPFAIGLLVEDLRTMGIYQILGHPRFTKKVGTWERHSTRAEIGVSSIEAERR
jgi:hypothetical protein